MWIESETDLPWMIGAQGTVQTYGTRKTPLP